MAVKTDKTQFGPGVPETLRVPEGGHRPFDGRATALEVPGPVNVAQLLDEVYERLGGRSAHQVVYTDDGDGGRHLHVLGEAGEVDADAVRQVIAAHTPDDGYGLDEATRQARALRKRLLEGGTLGMEELHVLLRAMLV
jgi:hypothetical protein